MSDFDECLTCEGRGQIYDEEGVDCDECEGTGSVPPPSAKVCKCKGGLTAQFWDGGHLPDCPVVAPSGDRK